MYLTEDQERILSLLEKTRFMRTDQALRYLNGAAGEKEPHQVAHCLKQLRHIGRICRKTDTVFALPGLYASPVDEDMLAAVDVMLDLTAGDILALSVSDPALKLRFFSGGGENGKCYAVAAVAPGTESTSAALFDGISLPEGSTLMLLLSEEAQMNKLRVRMPHYFVIRGPGGLRYFEGAR